MSPAWFFAIAAAVNAVTVVLLVATIRERRRIEELRRPARPLDAELVAEATRRLRR